MKTDLVMPQMGESVAEGTVTKWYAKVGDAVQKDQTVLSISTDKVDAEIPAPAAGTLAEILVQEGQKVNIGTVLARIETGAPAAKPEKATSAAAKSSEPPPPSPAPEATKPVEPPPAAKPASAPVAPPNPSPAAVQQKPAQQPPPAGERAGFYSPLVLNIARVDGVSSEELASIRGSGLGGRVQKKDILAYVEARKAGGVSAPAARGSAPAAPAYAASPGSGGSASRVRRRCRGRPDGCDAPVNRRPYGPQRPDLAARHFHS